MNDENSKENKDLDYENYDEDFFEDNDLQDKKEFVKIFREDNILYFLERGSWFYYEFENEETAYKVLDAFK